MITINGKQQIALLAQGAYEIGYSQPSKIERVVTLPMEMSAAEALIAWADAAGDLSVSADVRAAIEKRWEVLSAWEARGGQPPRPCPVSYTVVEKYVPPATDSTGSVERSGTRNTAPRHLPKAEPIIERLREAATELGWMRFGGASYQKEFTGISSTAWSVATNRGRVSLHVLIRIAAGLRIRLEWLQTGKGERFEEGGGVRMTREPKYDRAMKGAKAPK